MIICIFYIINNWCQKLRKKSRNTLPVRDSDWTNDKKNMQRAERKQNVPLIVVNAHEHHISANMRFSMPRVGNYSSRMVSSKSFGILGADQIWYNSISLRCKKSGHDWLNTKDLSNGMHLRKYSYCTDFYHQNVIILRCLTFDYAILLND